VAGVPHVFGWGGVHGAREKYKGHGYFINMDVASLYPSLMIHYNLLSRSCNPEKFKYIVDTRLKYKREKNPLQAPLKIVINGTYGASKDKNNPLYDPRQANNVCVYGQLLLLDLIEHLEPYAEIIQSNTDGVLVKMPEGQDEEKFFNLIDDIAHEWEQRTGLQLEFDEYRKVFQKDVNNYIIVDPDGNYKSKGAWVKKLNNLDYDLAIVNKALVDFMVKGIPVEVTISKCDSLKEFQQVKKISNKYDCIIHGGKKLHEKTVRCFASNTNDGGLSKVHGQTKRTAKMEGTPEHCRLVNGNINGEKCPDWLDKSWYIDLARKRLQDFGF
jgi:DNA polymerase